MIARSPSTRWPALVLTAGLGTRARPLTYDRAKAALPVAGVPLVHRILRRLHAAGVRDVVLNLHHLPHTITGLVGDGTGLGVTVRYSFELPLLGSAGGPRRALPLLAAPRFFIVNGDTLTDVDLEAVAAAHRESGALVTMALIPNPAPQRYGGVVVDRGGIIRGFTRRGSTEPSFHFIGVQVAEAEAFAPLPDGTPDESVGRLYPRLMAERPGSIRALVCDASFLDIGTPGEYLATSLALAAHEGGRDALVGLRARIAADALVEDSVLWDDVAVGPGARVTRSVVGDRVVIPAGARIDACAIVRADRHAPLAGERVEGGLLVHPLETR